MTVPLTARAAGRAAKREPEPQEEPAGYDDPHADDGAAPRESYDDYGDDQAPPHDEPYDDPQEAEATGSLPPVASPKKAAKTTPPTKAKAQKSQAPVKGRAAAGKKQLPRPVLFAAAAGIVLVLVTVAVLALGSPSTGDVSFMVPPSVVGATLQVNGKEVPLDTLLTLEPGQYQVTATAPGHEPLSKKVEVAAGSRIAVSLPLKPVVGDPPPGEAPRQPSENGQGGTVVATGKTGQDTGSDETPPKPSGNAPPPGTPESAQGTGKEEAQVAESPETTPPEPAAPRKVAAIFKGEEGAEISVNGKSVGRVPEARIAELEPGKTYRYTAKLAGYQTYSGRFTANGSRDEMEVAFELEKESEKAVAEERRPPVRPVVNNPPKPRPGKVLGKFACSTKPAGAEILVDGKKTGRQTPVTLGSPLMLPVGNRKISFRLNGKTTKPQTVAITEEGVAKLVNVPIE